MVRFCLVCLRLVYPLLPVSLHCPFLIATSVFSNIDSTICQLYHRDIFVKKSGYIHMCIICMCKTYNYKIYWNSSKLCMRVLIVIYSLIGSFLKELSPFLFAIFLMGLQIILLIWWRIRRDICNFVNSTL